MGSIGLALIAGVLSTFSPCVLPLVPVVLGTALGEHRFGPVALAAGLALSFVIIGLFVATVGFAAGLDHDVFRSVAAVLLIAVGVVLLVPRLQTQLATASGPDRRLGAVAMPATSRSAALAANSASAFCSAWCGARASGRRWAPPRCWPRAPRT